MRCRELFAPLIFGVVKVPFFQRQNITGGVRERMSAGYSLRLPYISKSRGARLGVSERFEGVLTSGTARFVP
jgi:hypothetical protein